MAPCAHGKAKRDTNFGDDIIKTSSWTVVWHVLPGQICNQLQNNSLNHAGLATLSCSHKVTGFKPFLDSRDGFQLNPTCTKMSLNSI